MPRLPRLIALFLSLMMGSAPSGAETATSGAAPATTVDFPVFVGGFGIDVYHEAARRFEAEHPGLRIHVHGNARVAEQVRVRVLAGDWPTMTDAVLPWDKLVAAGRVLDLAPSLEGPAHGAHGRWRDRFAPGTLAAWSSGDATWGVPFSHAAIVLFHDAALLRQHGWPVPRTWDDLLALAPAIEAAGLAPFVLPGTSPTAADYLLRSAYHRLAGPEAYARWQAGDPTSYDDPRLLRAAGLVQRLVRDHALRGWEGMSHTEAQLQFLRGKAVFLVTGSWFVNEMRDRLPPTFELGVANLPGFAEGEGHPDAVQTGSGTLFVFADAPPAEREAAVAFLRFLTSPAEAEAFVRAVDSPAAVVGIPREAYDPMLRPVADLLATAPQTYGRPPGLTPAAAELRQAEVDARQGLLACTLDPTGWADLLRAAARRAEARAADPDLVEVRHPLRAALVAGLIVGAFALLAFLGLRDRARARREGRPAAGLAFASADAVRVPRRDLFTFLLPGLVVYLGFLLLPAARTLGWSTLRWDGAGESAFAGTAPLRRWLLESDTFGTALANNLFLTLAPAALVIPASLGLAVLLRSSGRAAAWYRATFLFPNLLGGLAATLVWQHVYNPQSGLLNAALTGLGDLAGGVGFTGAQAWLAGFDRFAWLGPETFLAALVPIYLWLHLGFNLVLFLAALDRVDPALHEAAALDGAGPWTRFWRVSLPLVADVVVLSALFLVISGFATFELVWILTGQQPPAGLHVLGTLLVSTLFQDFRVGDAAALAVLQTLLLAAAALLLLRLGRRGEVAS